MNNFPSQKTVDRIKSEYKKGTRVRLDRMNDFQAPPIGTLGTVDFVDDIGSIHVIWDTGSTLAVAYGEDSCTIVSQDE